MIPNPFEEKELRRMDLRVRAYRENQWNRLEGFDPFEKMMITFGVAFALAVLTLVGAIIIWAKWIA